MSKIARTILYETIRDNAAMEGKTISEADFPQVITEQFEKRELEHEVTQMNQQIRLEMAKKRQKGTQS